MVRLFWVLAIGCVLVSIGLFWTATTNSGSLIVIDFRDGYGLKPEDRLKHLGIDVGEVEQVELRDDLQALRVHVRLIPRAESLAREGTKFWIVRPTVSLDGVRGLDTILGPKYIAVEPGPGTGMRQSNFQGLENPPTILAREGSLEIVLDAATRHGLENGAPVMYRGFRVGQVLQVGLASDSRSVRARCAIDPEYRDLIRVDTKFWNRSGWKLDIGLNGMHIDADTLGQFLHGGVEFATPVNPGVLVSTGHRFELVEKGDSEWTKWKPSLASGSTWSKQPIEIPTSQRIALRWQEKYYGIKLAKQSIGWCLPMDDGSIACLESLARPSDKAISGSVRIEVAGISFEPPQQVGNSTQGERKGKETHDRIQRIRPTAKLPVDLVVSPTAILSPSPPKQACDCIIASHDSQYNIVIDHARLQPSPEGWSIDPTIAIDRDAHGLPVLSAEEHIIIGMVSTLGGKNAIRLFGAEEGTDTMH